MPQGVRQPGFGRVIGRVIAVAIVTVVAACSGPGDDDADTTLASSAPTAPPTSTAVATEPPAPPTTQAAPATTAAEPIEAGEITTTTLDGAAYGLGEPSNAELEALAIAEPFELRGFDLEQVTVAWLGLYNTFLQNPTDDALEMYGVLYAGGGDADFNVLVQLEELVDQAWAFDGDQLEVVAVRVLELQGPADGTNGFATVEWADRGSAVNVVDELGNVVRTEDGWGLRIVQADLIASRFDGRWRIEQSYPAETGITMEELVARDFTILESAG